MRTVTATRYVIPLREGGSLPGIVEADDDGLYVLKFRGAGQGPKALVAELIAGELARALELPIPEIVFANVDPILGRSEPDAEVQNLIKASGGLNLAMDFLPGALAFDAAQVGVVDADLASRIVWFDAFVSNVDRTARNTNMLVWHKQIYLIDHGAALYFQHNWITYRDLVRSPFQAIKDHVLLRAAANLAAANERSRDLLTSQRIQDVAALVPEDWLFSSGHFQNTDQCRRAYVDALCQRLDSASVFVAEAHDARTALV